MASFNKTRFGWQAQIARRIGDKTVRKAKTFKYRREAEIWARETEASLSAGTSCTDTLSQVFDRYARERSAFKKGKKWEVIRLEQFKRQVIAGKAMGDFIIGEITTADFVAWRDQRGREVKPESVRREMTLLKHVFSTATDEWELINVNPLAKVKKPEKAERRKRRVYPDEIEKISAALDLDAEPWTSEKQITGAMFLFAIETAMRCGEIRGIVNRRVNGRVIRLPETKNGSGRDVPMTERAVEILNIVRNGNEDADAHPFNIDAVSRDSRFRTAVSKAGIEDLHFHDSRHEAITRLAKRLQVLDLARMTGHRNLNELLTYYEASGDDLADLLNASTSKDEIR